MGVNPTGFSTTAGDNTSIGGVSSAEGNSVRNQNNIDRALAAGMKELILTTGGSLALAGGTTAYTVTTPYGLSAYIDGLSIVAEINATNTDESTLNADSVGAKPIVNLVAGVETVLAAGDLVIGARERFDYDASLNSGSGAWVAVYLSSRAKVAADVATLQAEVKLTAETAQATTSGTAFDFTGIPAGVKRITVLLNWVTLSGSDNILIQIGDSGGIDASSYSSNYQKNGSGGFSSGSGFNLLGGALTRCVIENISGNTWLSSALGVVSSLDAFIGSGSKTLSDTLTQVRVTRSGSNTFSSGSVNILYE